ncbi:hypothetical protein X777_11912 [Ooceraea biroi]|uniref:Uncharacterized protein n=1 Tax=Ooceraea biroi TaxID=2015173 RepID=A0A026W301_OOCBI|nr:hypothetical protein X777_11912 [Ooceraea biroi]
MSTPLYSVNRPRSLNYTSPFEQKVKKRKDEKRETERKGKRNRRGRLRVVEPVLARKSGASCISGLSANQNRGETFRFVNHHAAKISPGTEPQPRRPGLMAGKEQPGRLPVRTFVSAMRCHCSQGFETRVRCSGSGARHQEGSEKCSHHPKVSAYLRVIAYQIDLHTLYR